MVRDNKDFAKKDKEHYEKKGLNKERDRMVNELLKEGVDLEIIQKTTKFYMSVIIIRKIKLLEKQLEIELKKEGKTIEL